MPRPGWTTELLDLARRLATQETGLAVVITHRHDGTAHASVVNAAVIDHPVSNEPVVGFVVQGGLRQKAQHLRQRRDVTVVLRSGWDWVTIEGEADLVGPDHQELVPWPASAATFHAIYVAALGGSLADWELQDDTAERDGHVAVLVRPHRVYSSWSRRARTDQVKP